MRYQNIELHNVCDIVEKPSEPGFTTSRLPLSILEQVNPGARKMATHGAGCEVRGLLAPGGEARVTLQALDTNVIPPIATVYHGCFRAQAVVLGPEPVEIVIREPAKLEIMEDMTRRHRLPFQPRLVRVCLPPIHPVRVVRIEGDLSYPPADATPARTLLCYGSSITHGATAVLPQGTYAAQCARRLGFDLINLGFGGAAQMDEAIAGHIARLEWDVATLEMGINVRAWPVERFQEAVERFVGMISRARPDKPVFCIDLFTFEADYTPNPPKAPAFREVVREVVGRLNADRVTHIDGRTLLRDPSGLQTDLVHPADDGMYEMGLELATVIRQKLG